jgi:histidinol-phosphate phosphatase family protein
VTFDVVIPTVGRESLTSLLARLEELGLPTERIHVVDDRAPGQGPAAARNRGWLRSHADWIVFLDDDVLPGRDWLERLEEDLGAAAAADVAGSQGRLVVPLPSQRPPTDWERNVAGLERARWATADMAYRRDALLGVGGFDERFPRAFREDADLALRVLGAGHQIVEGSRTTSHPVRPADPWVSLRLQRGNADDALMEEIHGPDWYERAGAPRGRRARHMAVTAAGLAAFACATAGRRRLALVAGAPWAAETARFAWERIAPGPLTPAEIAAMSATSAMIPPVATYHWLAGKLRARGLGGSRQPEAVLFDRDGTLVADVPYNGDPDRVVPMPRAREALARLRAAGIPTAVVSNQSGVGRGFLSEDDVAAVNRRMEELLGPLGPLVVCPHAPGTGCSCRKPAPGLVYRAAAALGVKPERCVLIGDIGADVEAARAAGARAVLVPTKATRPAEIGAASHVAPDLEAAVELVLGGMG